ncbi:MAG: single-stranded DNA-binding protein [Deltaproteobacteria bacterium]|nr:single-stranded DNA-binding protein [Deltaproteobacteria bacterium]
MSVNKAIIVGRLGADPELRFTPSGRAVANFNIATDSVWKDRDGNRQKNTEWHKIVVWGPQAETCSKYLQKGREVFIEGEIRTRNYEDKEGVKRYVTEIVARDVRFLGGRGERDGAGAGDFGAPTEPPGGFDGGDAAEEDIPF